MIKRAAVTGHTSGLGASFYKLLSKAGYEVHGFSRSNGYDLRDYSCVGSMLLKTQGFDLFINNAKPDYAQSQIIYRLVREWTSGTAISIGSYATIKSPEWNDTFLLEYLTQKSALVHAHKVLEPVAKCKLIIVHPRHLTDTDLYVQQAMIEMNL